MSGKNPQDGNLTFFEKQRDLLISEIGVSMESVLNNINALNRSMENAVAVGKEFDSVSQLWSNFYDGMNQSYNSTTKNYEGSSQEVNSEGINDTAKEGDIEQESKSAGDKIQNDVAE